MKPGLVVLEWRRGWKWTGPVRTTLG